ncbi:VOC family protein [Micromonospora sp. KLBMP9576]|uniref:VOC family protein n=1 Tax=Micromonospora sp. KLBMP9576 TaxID=3424769 RepID=UPI003D92DCEC
MWLTADLACATPYLRRQNRPCRLAPARVYCAVMTSRLLAVTFDAHAPARLAQFWAGMLGREVTGDADDDSCLERTTSSAFASCRTAPSGWGPRRRTHLHLTSASHAEVVVSNLIS